MRPQGRLQVVVGFASSAGRRQANQDFGGADTGKAGEAERQGIFAAVADGAGGPGGGVAAELAVRSFLDDMRAADDLHGIAASAAVTLEAYNRWLHEQARVSQELRGAATTFTAAVLRGRRATLVHVGDSRAWHFRDGVLALLTEDHVALQPDGSQRLQRALGLEPMLRLDTATQAIERHDRFLLSTDGVHGHLPRAEIARLLGRHHAPQADAEGLVDAALSAGGHDNATALVIDIVEVPAIDHDVVAAHFASLPILPPPAAGEAIDGFTLERVISDTPAARLFLARDGRGPVALKFPKAGATEDAERRRFMREMFLGQRVSHRHIGTALAWEEGRQSHLYLAMPWLQGETAHERLQRGRLPVEDAVAMARKVGRGLAALHRTGVTHRDVKPQNIMLLADGEVKLIDLGVARLPGADDAAEPETPGTLDYMAPELFKQRRGDALSDQYALGATLYVVLAGRHPQGDTPPGHLPLFGPVVPPSRLRSDIPAWLDAAILRALATRREERFGDVEEFVHELEHGPTRPAPAARCRPLIERNPVRFWQGLCVLLGVLLVFSAFRR